MRMKPFAAVGVVVCFVLLSAASSHAEWPSIQAPEAKSSGIVKMFIDGLRKPHVQHHRSVSSPPLPRPRPSELPRETAELNKAAPELAPSSELNGHPAAPTSAEASKVLEGGPAPTSSQTSGANRKPAEAALSDLANAPAEVAASVEANDAPAAESGPKKTTPALSPAVSAKPNQAEALAPIND